MLPFSRRPSEVSRVTGIRSTPAASTIRPHIKLRHIPILAVRDVHTARRPSRARRHRQREQHQPQHPDRPRGGPQPRALAPSLTVRHPHPATPVWLHDGHTATRLVCVAAGATLDFDPVVDLLRALRVIHQQCDPHVASYLSSSCAPDDARRRGTPRRDDPGLRPYDFEPRTSQRSRNPRRRVIKIAWSPRHPRAPSSARSWVLAAE
jgi:hypothetical protein